ncbi:uncharacterized protein E0L32_010791 [Thyridium curvatum]|uniref:Aminotransferase class I/classII large domain-containing protein n=1 Tax=Thyridium curvatum TaxID=1093900 RepID=A0A507AM51_9PEZI|nr:uncharacterized protein E0L32_010791 [Thyridium curvatum]TPX07294.1 hypothetical protein E0L32_010791 [Thyridium curvatum]
MAASLRRQEVLWEIMANTYSPNLCADGFINLGIAENGLMQAELLAHIKKKFDPQRTALSYGEGPNGSARLRAAVASFINSIFSPFTPVDASHISVSNGVTGSIERCAFELGDPGDAFLLGRPYYGAFPAELGDRAQIRTIPVSFGEVDPFGLAAVSIYESSIIDAHARSQRVRALLLCNPHNPLGRCYAKEVLTALMRLCHKYQIHLVVDEVYALSTFRNPENRQAVPFTSTLTIDTTGIIDPALLHVFWGMSKDFGCNGLRIGCVISQANRALIAALDAHAPYCYPAAFLDYIACTVLEDHEFVTAYIIENRRRLGENYAIIATFLNKFAIPFFRGTNAGLFVWANLGAAWSRRRQDKTRYHLGGTCNGIKCLKEKLTVDSEELQRDLDVNMEVQRRLLAEKVYIIDGDELGSEVPGWFRIVFAQPKDILEKGLNRIASAFDM